MLWSLHVCKCITATSYRYKRGRAHGREARAKGVNVLLGPAMGPLGRMPAGGRNWEGFGSDPVLQGVAAAQTIRGIQDEGVMATGTLNSLLRRGI